MTGAALEALAEAYDLVVVGAGPAGLSAALTASGHGLAVLVVDENPTPGGQIHRAVTTTPVPAGTILGKDYWQGAERARRFLAAPVAFLPGAGVWCVTGGEQPASGFAIGVSCGGVSRLIGAAQCILATGALERPMPIPGWTLPGVMTAGAAQALLKTSGLIPRGPVVLAGSGPLIYALAAEIAAAGGQLSALLDTTPAANFRKALPFLPGFLASRYAAKGFGLALSVRRHLPFISGLDDLAVEEAAGGGLEVRFRRGGGPVQHLPADAVFLHQGVIPDINLSSAAGCAHDWDPRQLCWRPRTDETFQTTVAGLAVAGDGAGIGGAEGAAVAGEIAALGALHRLGRLPPDDYRRQLQAKRRAWAGWMRGRAFIDRLFQPARPFRLPIDPRTIVCRCESVDAGRLRQAIEDGGFGPNQLKAFTRCGMGPCQGRLCGVTVSEMIADARGISLQDAGYFHLRPPVKPITLGELAALHGGPDEG